MSLADFKQQLNEWGRDEVPFLFVVDFEMEQPQVWRLDELDSNSVLFNFNGVGNGVASQKNTGIPTLTVNPISYPDFTIKFDKILYHLNRGDSFLTNLTLKSVIESKPDLKELFHAAEAKYKLWIKEQFLFFSPEIFVQIADGRITTYPMKGTIDAAVPDAANKILSDPKELAEHITIVDLLRNDLGLVSTNVSVNRFRYIDEIKTSGKNILQVSSEISGQLAHDYHEHLGDILVKLLPAGSISGAPKRKTVEIIHAAEGEKRGYYTGVAGCFDGKRLDSCVMIRFMEQDGDQFYYRSGAGLTAQSTAETEYQEILDKIYVPVN
jgi:para-aminobenzoate synthetase component 1